MGNVERTSNRETNGICLFMQHTVYDKNLLLGLHSKSMSMPRQVYASTVQSQLLGLDIHMSMHSNILPNYSQQDATFLDLFLQTLYIFQAVPRPSSGAHNCTCSFRYCQPVLLLAATVEEMELISSVVASSSSIV